MPVPDGFVHAKQDRLMLDGHSFYFSGTNNYYMMYKPKEMVVDVLDSAVALDLKAIRIWGFMDGTSTGDNGWHDGYSIQRLPGEYHESGLKKIDFILSESSKRKLKIVIALVNYWSDFGGMEVYARWAGAGGRESFYTNERCRQLFKDYIKMMANRVNTITGVRYKDDPTIMAWNLTNEARSQDRTGGTILRWTAEMSGYLRSVDPHHLISLGDEGGYCYDKSPYKGHEYQCGHGLHWPDIVALPDIDYGTFHNYGLDWWGKDMQWTVEWIRKHVRDAREIGKPAVLEEYGKIINNYPKMNGPADNSGSLTDQRRLDGMKPLADALYEMRGAADFSWMLTGKNTRDADINDPFPLYRDRWPDGFQFTGHDPLVAPFLSGHARRMTELNITEPPVPFQLVLPEDGQAGVSVLPLLEWDDSRNAAEYTLTLADNPALSNPYIKSGIKSGHFKITRRLDFETKYFWCVTAENSMGGTHSGASSFTTQMRPSKPGAFRQLAPVGEDVPVSPKFAWEASAQADEYTLEVARDNKFDVLAARVEGIRGNRHALGRKLARGVAYWYRVTAYNIVEKRISDNWKESGFKTELPEAGIADFENGVSQWKINPGGGKIAAHSDHSVFHEGVTSMRLEYTLPSYAGVIMRLNNSYAGYGGIEMWLKTDGEIAFVLQVKETSSEYWEHRVHLDGHDGDVFFDFAEFKMPSWSNTGNGILDLESIEELALYVEGDAGGVLWVDDIRLSHIVYSSMKKSSVGRLRLR